MARPEISLPSAEIIVRLIEELGAAPDLGAAASSLLMTLRERLEMKSATLYLAAPERKLIEPCRSFGVSGDPILRPIPFDSHLVKWLLETGGPVHLSEFLDGTGGVIDGAEEILQPLVQSGHSYGVALVTRGELVGVLLYGVAAARQAPGKPDDETIRMLARAASIMLKDALFRHASAASKEELDRFCDLRRSFIGSASREMLTSVEHLRSNLCSLEREQVEGNIVLDMALDSAARLQEDINRLLALNDIGFDGSSLNLESLEISSIADEVLREMIPELEEKQIRAPVDDQARGRKVFVDSRKIAIVIRSLLDNAVASVARGGAIAISIHVSPEGPASEEGIEIGGPSGRFPARIRGGQSYIVLSVKDDGIGIYPARMQALAGRREPASDPTGSAGEGSEIGLSVSRAIVAAHGGALFCKSDLGQGARFSMWLPLDV